MTPNKGLLRGCYLGTRRDPGLGVGYIPVLYGRNPAGVLTDVPVEALFTVYGQTYVEGGGVMYEVEWPDLSEEEDRMLAAHESGRVTVFTDPTDGSTRTLLDGKDYDRHG